jgi:glycerophosphoryl diester phosphodiesterase
LTAEGLFIDGNTHRTRLKWHRLRRSLADPEFGATVMAEGLRLGASMELDLCVRADAGFVVMHDNTLDRETTGTGPVGQRHAAELAGLTYQQSGLPLILSEALAHMLPAAHPEALLQFDMKDDYATIGPAGVAHLAAHFGDCLSPIIFSAGCADLICALAQALPQIPRGIDPTDHLVAVAQDQGLSAVEAALIAALRSGAAPDTCYLNWELLLAAVRQGLDLVALCHAEGIKVDAWTYTLKDPARGFSDEEATAFRALMSMQPDQITTDEACATETAWTDLMSRADWHA